VIVITFFDSKFCRSPVLIEKLTGTNIPAVSQITDGKVHNVKTAPQILFKPQGNYAIDRAHVDFA
jgi:hypothetical protein